MTTEKEKLQKSVNVLIEEASAAAELARLQRKTADVQSETAAQQHVTAHKLEDLSEALTRGAADLKKTAAGLNKD